MNKFLTFLLICFFGSGFSQNEILWETHFAGNVSQMSGDGYSGFRKVGLEAGFGGVYPLDSKGHFFGFKLNYNQKGVKKRRNEEEGDYTDYTLAMDYIEIPVSYLFPLWGVYFETGLSASYNIRFKQINNGVTYAEPTNLRAIEMGLFGAVNFEINKHLVFGIKYLNSLTPIQKNTVSVPLYYWFQQGGMHQMLGLQLQYFFNRNTFSWNQKKETKKENED